MFKTIKKNSRVDESCNTMEPETIQKNGASPKSRTSRRNFRRLSLLYMLPVVLAGGLTFFSCDDEEDKGDGGTTTLSPPASVYASQSGSSVSISWNYVSGATYYEVYRSSTPYGYYEEILYEEGTNAMDWSPLSGDNYYKIRAVKASGSSEIRSDYSNYAYASFSSGSGGGGGEPGALSAPASVYASQSGSSVSISWSSVSGATQYFVYRSSSATGSYTSLTSVSETSATDASPLNGYNYYKVKASNGSTTSDFSSYASVNYTGGSTSTKPGAPTGVTVSNEGNAYIPMITVRWNSVSEATSYKVYRSASANGSYSQIGSSTAYTVSTDDNPREGTSYYKVKAVNSAGESDFSDYASFTYTANDVSPCPVTYGNCTVSGTSITMRWTVPTSSGCGTPTKAYLRVKHPDVNEYVNLQELSGNATSASFTYTPWVNSDGFVYVGIITENSNGASGGTAKVYDNVNKRWIN